MSPFHAIGCMQWAVNLDRTHSSSSWLISSRWSWAEPRSSVGSETLPGAVLTQLESLKFEKSSKTLIHIFNGILSSLYHREYMSSAIPRLYLTHPAAWPIVMRYRLGPCAWHSNEMRGTDDLSEVRCHFCRLSTQDRENSPSDSHFLLYWEYQHSDLDFTNLSCSYLRLICRSIIVSYPSDQLIHLLLLALQYRFCTNALFPSSPNGISHFPLLYKDCQRLQRWLKVRDLSLSLFTYGNDDVFW